jgi:hypothetical protein
MMREWGLSEDLIKRGNDRSDPRSGAVRQLNASAYPQSKKARSGIK